MDGSGADDTVCALHALRQMADDHRDAQAPQVGHCFALVEIGAGDHHPGAVEDFGQGSHGDPADAYQVGTLTGLDIRKHIVFHRVYTLFSNVYNKSIIHYIHFSYD